MLTRGIKPIYTAVNAAAAKATPDELCGKWVTNYAAIIRLRQSFDAASSAAAVSRKGIPLKHWHEYLDSIQTSGLTPYRRSNK